MLPRLGYKRVISIFLVLSWSSHLLILMKQVTVLSVQEEVHVARN